MSLDTLSALALSSLIALGDANSIESWDTIEAYQIPAISGLWAYDANKHCREYYNFGKNGTLNTVSAGEKTKGTYRFVYSDELSMPMLAMTTTQDNNEKDCLGAQIDQSGQSMAFFVKLNSRHTPTKMQWCANTDESSCFNELYRILP